jgi:hypothetical protein
VSIVSLIDFFAQQQRLPGAQAQKVTRGERSNQMTDVVNNAEMPRLQGRSPIGPSLSA